MAINFRDANQPFACPEAQLAVIADYFTTYFSGCVVTVTSVRILHMVTELTLRVHSNPPARPSPHCELVHWGLSLIPALNTRIYLI